MKGNSWTVDIAPLRIDEGESRLQLHAAGSTSSSVLPPDWIVQEKKRTSSRRIDRVYIEPNTGKKFRSLPAAELYLSENLGVFSPQQSPEKHFSDESDEMHIFPVTPGSSDFVLPDGWTVEERQRASSSTIDKYYIEPETGKKFRSAIAVKRHLNETGYESVNDTEPEPRKKLRSESAVKKHLNESSNESAVEVRAPRITVRSPNFVLPDDWVIKTHRRAGSSSHVFDKYYIEPETGRQFRSLVSVERYLIEKEDEEFSMRLKDFKRPTKLRVTRKLESKSTKMSVEMQHPENSDGLPTKSEENTTPPKEATPDHESGPSEHSDTPMKNDAAEVTEAPKEDFGNPPPTLNWVLAGPAGDMWNPYVNEFMVPESTKQKWSETFISSLNDDDK